MREAWTPLRQGEVTKVVPANAPEPLVLRKHVSSFAERVMQSLDVGSSLRVRLLAWLFVLGLVFRTSVASARNILVADGPGNTYELISTAYTYEVPDCGHTVQHITEDFDDELQKNVFIFHIHVRLDDDRCGAKDRQRTEIRAKSADIVAQNGETVYYRWKFKLAAGFQADQSFTHIMQIKSNQGAPIMTLTPRTTTLAIDGRIGERGATPLSKFVGVWVVVDLKVLFSNNGTVAMTIHRISDGQTLFDYSGNADTWDDNSGGHDSKFGIYRSLDHPEMLRDEDVRFADFCASKVSASECQDDTAPPPPVDAGVDARRNADAGSTDEGRSGSSGAGGAGGAGAAQGVGGSGGVVVPPSGGAGGSRPDDAGQLPPGDAAHSGPSHENDLAGGCACELAARVVTPDRPLAWLGVAVILAARRRQRRTSQPG
jgi:hypothetical protein